MFTGLQTAHSWANTGVVFRELSFSRLEWGVHDRLHRRVEKGSSRRHCLCRLVPYLNNSTLQVYNTQFPIGDNHLNNHTNNVLAMLLQSCKNIRKQGIVAE